MQRDEQARMQAAREKGVEKGETIGRVRVLQSLLGVFESTVDELRTQSLDDLAAMEGVLKRQLRERS